MDPLTVFYCQVVLFEGGEGAVQGQLVDPSCKGAAHAGGVFALSWSPDGQKLLTASGDKTCKIWNVESKTLETYAIFRLFNVFSHFGKR
jgi:WD40 repeat protein